MPTYEYKCEECGHQFETVQSIKAEALTDCPECVGAIKRMITRGAGFILKGKGFHKNDYPKEPHPLSVDDDEMPEWN